MSRFLPSGTSLRADCPHQAPLGAIQIEPGLWSHGKDLYVFHDEFVGDRAEFVLAAILAALKRTIGFETKDFAELLATALGLAAAARYETAFPEEDMTGGGIYICPHAAPEGVTR